MGLNWNYYGKENLDPDCEDYDDDDDYYEREDEYEADGYDRQKDDY